MHTLFRYMLARWYAWNKPHFLTPWGWVKHICISKLTIIGSDNGLLPGRHQAIIWTNTGILLSGKENAFENVIYEMEASSSRPQCVHLFGCEARIFCTKYSMIIIALPLKVSLIVFVSMNTPQSCTRFPKISFAIFNADFLSQKVYLTFLTSKET